MIGIYKITSPSGKVYIGKSVNIRKRFNLYTRLFKQSIGNRLYNSFLKYGVENHKFEIAYTLPDDVAQEVLDRYEIFYIQQYKDCGFEMLNLTKGGEGSVGYKHTTDAIIKMKKAKKNKYIGENNPNFGKGLFGNKNPMYGIKRPEVGALARKICSKKVFQYDSLGKFIKVWNSVSEASKTLNLKIANISGCALNKPCFKTAGGYSWKYN